MANRIYHVGFRKDGNTVVVEAATSIDCPSCELWQYKGQRETTKTALKARVYGDRKLFLDTLNAQEGTAFKYVRVE
jgi:hypothetical protein